MSTLTQVLRQGRSVRVRHRNSKDLAGCPQKKGTCLKVLHMTPRKPNSAIRKVARVLTSNLLFVYSYIPGIGHNLTKHSSVIICGGPIQDLPGVKYTSIRGKGDLQPLLVRRNKRSRYGAKRAVGIASVPYRRTKLW